MELRLITPPVAEPLSLASAQDHLRAAVGGSDAELIGIQLAAAREAIEAQTGRALPPQTWQLRLPAFPETDRAHGRIERIGAIVLPRPPLIEVTELRYTSPAGADTLLAPAAYQVVAPSGPEAAHGRLYPAPGTEWPATREDDLAAVRITFRAGYATVPAALRAAVLLMLGDLYAMREATVTGTVADNPAVARLVAPFRTFAA